MPKSGRAPGDASPTTPAVAAVDAEGGTSPGPAIVTKDPLAELRHHLQRLHREAGEPSTRDIARRTGAISHTTVHSVLRCEKTPGWAHLELIVETLGGDTERFRGLWLAGRPTQPADPDERMAAVMTRTMEALSGLLAIVDLLASLVRRAGRCLRPAPMLCLVSPGRGRGPLPLLAHALGAGARQVPHVLVPTAGTDLHTLLHHAADGLAAHRSGAAALRFPHFGLVTRLMSLDVSTVRVEAVRRRLAARTGAGPIQRRLAWLPAPIGTVNNALHWLRRQPYLAPRQSPGTLAFAVRLTAGARDGEDQVQLDKLLVHAFLQDLRVSYRRRPWRRAPWRRTARPILLIDGCAPDNAGYALLRLVNDVRNETGLDDPLLIVAGSRAVPPDGLPVADCPDGWVVPPDRIDVIHRAWEESLAAARRGRDGTAWYLPVGMPPMDDHSALRSRLPRITPPPVPLPARRGVLAGLLVLVLICGSAWLSPWLLDLARAQRAGCLPLSTAATVDVVWTGDGQCVGYSADAGQSFGDDPRLTAVLRMIFRQNRVVQESRAAHPNRPLVTLVYLARLTDSTGTSPATVVQALEGVAAAQYRANHEAVDEPLDPYLRVVVANEGWSDRYGAQVAGMLTALSQRDKSVTGVLAALPSTAQSRAVLQTLDAAGLLVLAPSMSADGIGDGLVRFLQLAPPNREQARLVHHYATAVLHRREIISYYSAGGALQDDLYVSTLRDDLRQAFGPQYQEAPWRPGFPMTDICADRYPGVVFYAGRYTDFPAFTAQIAHDCTGRLPTLLADDDTGASLVDTAAFFPSGFPAAVVSIGGSTPCAELAKTVNPEARRLYADLRAAGLRCDGVQHTDAGLYYDAARLVVSAARDAAAGTGSLSGRSAVYVQLLYGTDLRAYQGVTGPIQFDRTGAPVGRPLTMLCIADLSRGDPAGSAPVEADRIATGSPDPSPSGRPCPPRR